MLLHSRSKRRAFVRRIKLIITSTFDLAFLRVFCAHRHATDAAYPEPAVEVQVQQPTDLSQDISFLLGAFSQDAGTGKVIHTHHARRMKEKAIQLHMSSYAHIDGDERW
jgi:hypothetical protein